VPGDLPTPFRGSSDQGHDRRHPPRFPKPSNLDSSESRRPTPSASSGAGSFSTSSDGGHPSRSFRLPPCPAHLIGSPPGERSPPMPPFATRSGEAGQASPATIPPRPAPTLQRDASPLPHLPRRSHGSSSPVIPPFSAPQSARTAAPNAPLIPASLKPIPTSSRGPTHPMHPRCRRSTEYRSHNPLNTNHKEV
jgi:hypothetical protein